LAKVANILCITFCCLWPNIMELAASRIKNYANPTAIF